MRQKRGCKKDAKKHEFRAPRESLDPQKHRFYLRKTRLFMKTRFCLTGAFGHEKVIKMHLKIDARGL